MSFWSDFAAGQRDALAGRLPPVRSSYGYEAGLESVNK